MSLTKNILIWIFAIVFMASIAIYQRLTGPTYPDRGSIELAGEKIKFKLPRSSDAHEGEKIIIEVPNKTITGKINFRRFKSHDEWTTKELTREGNTLYAQIPPLPPAGKIMYDIALSTDGLEFKQINKETVVLRYKGKVPEFILYPHIFFMFVAMVFSTRTALEVLFKGNNVFILTVITTISFTLGGMILGPIVQEYAFGALWTGWPFGHDLTDNKTLVSLIMWIVAWWQIRKNPNATKWALIAAIVLLAVYLIPHSVLGSEIDFTKIPQHN